jgi:hypothetical protein
LVKNKKSHTSTSSNPPNSESITEFSRRKKNSCIDNSFLERPNMVVVVKRSNYFDYSTGEIRSSTDEGEDYETPTGIPDKMLLISFLSHYNLLCLIMQIQLGVI